MRAGRSESTGASGTGPSAEKLIICDQDAVPKSWVLTKWKQTICKGDRQQGSLFIKLESFRFPIIGENLEFKKLAGKVKDCYSALLLLVLCREISQVQASGIKPFIFRFCLDQWLNYK